MVWHTICWRKRLKILPLFLFILSNIGFESETTVNENRFWSVSWPQELKLNQTVSFPKIHSPNNISPLLHWTPVCTHKKLRINVSQTIFCIPHLLFQNRLDQNQQTHLPQHFYTGFSSVSTCCITCTLWLIPNFCTEKLTAFG